MCKKENMGSGFIALFRSFLDWDLYGDIPCKVLFIHLILRACRKDTTVFGVQLKCGSVLTSYNKLAEETGLTVKSVRNAICRLIKNGEITQKTTSKFQVLNVVNFGVYQRCEDFIRKELEKVGAKSWAQSGANKREAETVDNINFEDLYSEVGAKSWAQSGATNNNIPINSVNQYRECENFSEEKVDSTKKSKPKKETKKSFIPPSLDDVKRYITEKNLSVDAKAFYDYFDVGGWVDSKGNKVKNWKQKLITWSSHSKPKKADPKSCFNSNLTYV